MNLPLNLKLAEVLHGSGDGWSARAVAPDGREVCVKTYARPDGFFDDEAASDRKRKRFEEEKKREQAAASAAPDAFFAGRLEKAGDVLFWVRPYAPRSLRDWVAFKEIPDARRLSQVCLGIVRSLAALKRVDGSGHGNLTLGNILLAGKDGKGVRLVDPRAASAVQPRVDKRALGLVIYQLVKGEFVELDDRLTTVPEDEDWSSLGRTAGRWREFCSNLLNPYSPLSEKDWAEIEALLHDLEKAGNTGAGRNLAVAAVLVLLLGGGLAGYFLFWGVERDDIVVDEQTIEREWQEVLDDFFQWGRVFFESRRDFDERTAERRAFAARFQDTRRPSDDVVNLVIQVSQVGALFRTDPQAAEAQARAVNVLLLRQAQQEDIVRAHRFFADLRSRIADWEVYRSLEESREAFREDGFDYGVAELDRILAAVEFSSGALTYESLFALEAASAGVGTLQALHERYRRATEGLRAVTRARFPALYADHLQARLGQPEGDPVSYLGRLAGAGEAVLNHWRANADAVVEEPFARAESRLLEEAEVSAEATLVRWREIVEAHRRVDPALLAGARNRLTESHTLLADLEVRINELLEPGDARAAFVSRHNAARERFESAVDLEPIEANRSRFSEAVDSLVAALDQLVEAAEVRFEEVSPDIETGLAAMRATALPFTGPLAERWQTYIRSEVVPLREGSFATVRDFLDFRRRHDRARTHFLRFHEEGPAAVGALPPPRREGLPDLVLSATDALWRERIEAENDGLVRSVAGNLFAPEYPQAEAERAVHESRDRLASLQGALGSYQGDVSAGFAALDRWEEPEGGFAAFWQRLQAEGDRRAWTEDARLRPHLQPFRDAHAVATEPSAEGLAATAFGSSAEPVLRFFAFRRLSEAREPVSGLIERYGRSDRGWERSIPPAREADFRGYRQTLWLGAFRSAGSANARLRVAEEHGLFGVTAADISGPERVSFEIFLAMREVRENAPAYLNQPGLLAELVNTLATAPGGQQNPRMQSLLSQLREIRLDDDDAQAGASPFVERGWRIEEETEERMVLRWRDHRKTFHRVEGDRRDVFISETECSIGLFNDWMSDSGRWVAAGDALPTDWADFLRTAYNPMDDYRFGFRIWRPARRGLANGGLELNRQWFEVDTTVQDEYRQHESTLVPPDAISPDLPMNQMGARAARFFAESMGMRLPRPAEWERATRLVPGEDGRFWSAEWSGRVSDALRREIVLGSFYQEYRIERTGAGRGNGPILLPVDSGPHRFKHLAGNVAEFVFDADAGRYFVGGGSALAEVAGSWRELHPVTPRDERRVFSDVGLRLVFDAPLGAPHARFLALLEETWSDLS